MNRLYTDKAPVTEGGYPQAVVAGDHVFVSGMMGRRDSTGTPESGTVPWSGPDQAEVALQNVLAVLAPLGLGADSLVRLTLFITDLSELRDIHARLCALLGDALPAVSVAEVSALPRGTRIMLEATAYMGRR